MKLTDLGLKTETVTPLHPEAGDVGLRITICEPMSREFNAAIARLAPKIGEIEYDVVLAEAVTIGWEAVGDLEGLPDFSAEECAKLYRDPAYSWIASSVFEVVSKKKGYFELITKRLKPMQK